jgi:hypothetical protein
MGLTRPLRWVVAVVAVVRTAVSASRFPRPAHPWPVDGLHGLTWLVAAAGSVVSVEDRACVPAPESDAVGSTS